MSALTEVDSCLNSVMDIMNPRDLLVHVGVPALSGIVASRFVGAYQPDPNIPARRFSPITAAVYAGLSSVITKLAMDGACRISQHVTVKDVFDTFGTATLLVAAGTAIGVIAAKHIIARDTADYIGGEKIDFMAGSSISAAASWLL